MSPPSPNPADLPAELSSALNLCSSSSAAPTMPSPSPPSNPSQTADETLSQLQKTPLFMTSLDETSDPADADNIELEAMKALAYEGTKVEVAKNFKEQGNECVKARRWVDAREFYDRGLRVLRTEGVRGELEPEESERSVIDVEEEERQERLLEEQMCVNRALCNLELKNYRKTINDCTTALHLNPHNTKALYRTALAHLSLDKLPAASAAINNAVALLPHDAAITALSARISARTTAVASRETARQAAEAKATAEMRTLALALKARNVALKGRMDGAGVEMEGTGALIQLSDPADPASEVMYPVLLLYPTAAQSELIKAVTEMQTLGSWLDEVFRHPVEWDAVGEFAKDKVECYMDSVGGGLVKVGKKVILGKVLGGGKVEISDGLVRVYVVPKGRVPAWLEEEKKRRKR